MSYDTMIQTINLLSTAVFLWVGARMVMVGEISVGAFVAFNALLAMSCGAVLRSLGTWDELLGMVVLLNCLNNIFEQEPVRGRVRYGLIQLKSLAGYVVM